jgi:hypothetical protein
MLLTHEGFFTHGHHDGGGYGTFMILLCGSKVWAVLAPQTPITSKEKLFEVYDSLLGSDENNHYGTHGVIGTILLKRGDIL